MIDFILAPLFLGHEPYNAEGQDDAHEQSRVLAAAKIYSLFAISFSSGT
jgi:hypothetical protein